MTAPVVDTDAESIAHLDFNPALSCEVILNSVPCQHGSAEWWCVAACLACGTPSPRFVACTPHRDMFMSKTPHARCRACLAVYTFVLIDFGRLTA